jgi:hypothetical protein
VNGRRPGLWLVAAATVAGLAIGPFACSSSESLSGEGGSCILVTDCQTGLVCGKGPHGTGVCTDNTGSLQPPQDAGLAGDAASNPRGDAAAANDAAEDSATPAVDAASQGDDASPPVDAETTPDVEERPPDSSKPEDTAAPPAEASPPVPDAGPDAGLGDAHAD